MIQILLTAGLIACALYATGARNLARRAGRLILLFVMIGIYFVWVPDQTTIIAHLLGVGRGTDLILYIWIVLSALMTVIIHGKLENEARIRTELIRRLALANPVMPDSPVSPANDVGSAPRVGS